jgi:hypothetical protein
VSAALRRWLLVTAAGVTAFVAGIALDLRWHATHDEFEGASEQLAAHWLLWLGLVVVLVAMLLARQALGAYEWNAGLTVVLVAALAEIAVHAWHFIAHANEVDPELAHTLLTVGNALVVSGAVFAFVLARRRRRPGQPV